MQLYGTTLSCSIVCESYIFKSRIIITIGEIDGTSEDSLIPGIHTVFLIEFTTITVTFHKVHTALNT